MFNFGKQRKLDEEKKKQEDLIAAQLKALELDHELEYEKMTQKGLVKQQEQRIQKEKEEIEERQRQEKKKKRELAKKSSAVSSPSGDAENGIAIVDHDGDSDSSVDENAQPNQNQDKNYLEMARMGYQQLINAIIRPPRANYEMRQLGPSKFNFAGKAFEREDWTLMTERGYNLKVSQWSLVGGGIRPILIYLHGNASARLEVIPQLTSLLAMGMTVVSLDFVGSGKSDGEFVSLGYYEREDLATVVAHLRRLHHQQQKDTGDEVAEFKIALWGRSMGASTAIMYGARPDARVNCMICDSAFSSLQNLAEELVETARKQGVVVPNVVVSAAIQMIQWTVQKDADFNIRDLTPVKYAEDCDVPALFVHGEHDDFIKPHHSEDICEKYKGSKNLLMVEGDHNDPRPHSCIVACESFLQRRLEMKEEWKLLDVASLKHPMYPPWVQDSTMGKYKTTAASNGFDDKTMGMTTKRQQEIQSSINTMLGSGAAPSTPDAHAEQSSVEVEF
ncbi:unnamed protein product [Cylindrotheca closterium]|uniref:Serine aminopeptidase S33 domain-containing protein n=1 Tax=Cylindrotheca closterium TaxID=2856 RepID=A0AAD2CME2_9STRA|nr:unnamed protein product [Cylindrotheca closterium]